MYRGFQLNIKGLGKLDDKYLIAGENLYTQIIGKVRPSLLKLGKLKGPLDGSLIQNEWFPTSKGFDVFISHSHADRDAAVKLAGFLFQTFGLTCFIDSCIWGYSDELLRELDNHYCKIEGTNSYSYESRNGSTSHVHMMLTNALAMMIDNSECLFFLNTPNSVTIKDSVKKTYSPWIYTEVGISKWIEKRVVRQSDALIKAINESREKRTFSRSLSIEYTLDMEHLDRINNQQLLNWIEDASALKAGHPLDVLYKLNSE